MKLYVAFSHLDRSEWAGDTVYGSIRYGFELCLRGLVEDDEHDSTLVAHASLFFENVDDDAYALASDLLPRSNTSRSFFVDVLADGKHRVSTLEDPGSWYRKWSKITVALYPVAAKVDARSTLKAALRFVRERRPYDCYQNCNSVCEFWPLRCSPTCGLCCPCSAGTNCVECVVVALAAGLGAEEWESERRLGIARRTARGARLPSKLRDELLSSGVIELPPTVVRLPESSENARSASSVPLLLTISSYPVRSVR